MTGQLGSNTQELGQECLAEEEVAAVVVVVVPQGLWWDPHRDSNNMNMEQVATTKNAMIEVGDGTMDLTRVESRAQAVDLGVGDLEEEEAKEAGNNHLTNQVQIHEDSGIHLQEDLDRPQLHMECHRHFLMHPHLHHHLQAHHRVEILGAGGLGLFHLLRHQGDHGVDHQIHIGGLVVDIAVGIKDLHPLQVQFPILAWTFRI